MNSYAVTFRRKRDYIASKPNILIKVFDRLYAEAGRDAFYDQINLNVRMVLSSNPNITWEFINEHSEIKWFPPGVSTCANITWEIIKENLYSDYWDWIEISNNPNITWDVVKNNPLMPWNIQRMSAANPNIVWADIREYHMLNRNAYEFDNHDFLANNSITPEIIGTDPMFDKIHLSDNGFSRKASVTLDHVLDILPNNDVIIKTGEKTMTCVFDNFSRNPNITWAFVKKYGTDRPWAKHSLANNIKFSIDDLCEFWDIMVNCVHDGLPKNVIVQHLCANASITWEMICVTMSKIKWKWVNIARFNPNITVAAFEQLLQMRPQEEKAELIRNYQANSNITYEFICANWVNCDFRLLCHNKFLWDDTVYKREITRDIEDRRAAIKSVMNDAVGTAFNGVLRYIDYA
jgi:hypothetical protein